MQRQAVIPCVLCCIGLVTCGRVFAQDRDNRSFFAAATTVQQPTFGVAIDAQGILRSVQFADANDALMIQRVRQARVKQGGNLSEPSELRKLSLRGLSEAIEQRLLDGQSPSDAMLNLAGLLCLRYVFLVPKTQDIILAGPAEGWIEDASGRTLGATTRYPTILLDDLIVALAAHHPDRGHKPWVGCSIEPTQSAMAKLKQFNQSIPSAVPQRNKIQVARKIVLGTQQSLGLANILVFHLPPRSHMAQVMIEADYRMKLIALGHVPPPINMPVFFAQLKSPPRSQMQRWWFQADPNCVRLTPDRMNMELFGERVRLSTQDFSVAEDGTVRHTGNKPSRAAQAYADAFTERYAEIARASPAFKQLRNMIDLLTLAAFLEQEQALSKVKLPSQILWDPPNDLITSLPEPKRVPCLANARWNANYLLAVSGGVSIDAYQALSDERIQQENVEDLQTQGDRIRNRNVPDDSSWWWD